MNKLYKTLDLYAAWLVEVDSQYHMGGIKNIIGLKVANKGENLFFSILDDCFFRILPQNDFDQDILENFYERLFVQVYEYHKPPYELKTFGMELYHYIHQDYITKQEIIEIKKNQAWLFGYQSDFCFPSLNTTVTVDYENPFTIEENIIDTVDEYEEKRKRPLSYESDCIYGPHHYQKRLK